MKAILFWISLLAMASSGVAQSVTVGTSGGDFTSLTLAMAAVKANPAAPNVITFIDNGPFFEAGCIFLDEYHTGPDDLVIQGAPGIRPVLIGDVETTTRKTGMVYLRKYGNLTMKDLILIPPAVGINSGNYTAKVAETAIEIQMDNLVGTSITLENILISSNNGSNQPTAAMNGLTPPVSPVGSVSFRDEGILVQSQNGGNRLHHLTMNYIVVSGVNGDQGSDAIRGFPDGLPGSEWVLGPGTVLSYNGGHGFQPGGTTNFAVKLMGTQNNPVKIFNNNLSGISVTDQAGALSGLTQVHWAIIANNMLHGLNMGDLDTSANFQNMTIANNAAVALLGPASPNAVTYSFSNVIAAGDGELGNADNVIRLIQSGAGTVNPSFFNVTGSAIVLNGPVALNNTSYGGDGIESDANYTVSLSDITSADPQFLSLTGANPGFAVVSNQTYGSAGPGGVPLIGGGSFAPSSVGDWALF